MGYVNTRAIDRKLKSKMPTKRKLAVLLIKDKQIIISHFYLINIPIFDYPDSRLSGLFTEVPMSPDNRGSTVLIFFLLARNPLFQAQKSNIRSSVKEKKMKNSSHGSY